MQYIVINSIVFFVVIIAMHGILDGAIPWNMVFNSTIAFAGGVVVGRLK